MYFLKKNQRYEFAEQHFRIRIFEETLADNAINFYIKVLKQ